MQFQIEIKGLNKLQNAIDKSPREVFAGLSRAISTSVHIIRPLMRNEAPRGKSGQLRANIHARAVGLRGEVGPNLEVTPYAWFVHQGTSAYVIRPNKKKALWWPGAKHPVKKVNHPGIKANPFVERTFEAIKYPVQKIFEKEIEVLLTKFK